MNASHGRVCVRGLTSTVATFAILLAVAACGSSSPGSGSGSSTASAAAPTAQASTSEAAGNAAASCGGKSGAKASGAPLTFGAIATKQPGVDFTAEIEGLQAYFSCVNASGGVHGRPLALDVLYEQSNPQQVSADATKLLQSDHVLGMVGNMSLTDCSVNRTTYIQAHIYVIGAGVDNSCFSSPNFASTIAGPLYSQQMAMQALLSKDSSPSAAVSIETQCPGCAVYNSGAIAVAKAKGLKATALLQAVPVQSPASLVLQASGLAGSNGVVAIGFTGPDLVNVLNAAAQQGLASRQYWGCVGLCVDPSVSKALSTQWDGKIVAASDYPPASSTDPSTANARAVLTKYGNGLALSSLSEMGYLTGQITNAALQKLRGSELNRTGVNTAIRDIKDYNSHLLCKPWSYGAGSSHVPVYSDYIVTVKNGQWVEDGSGCVTAQATTPQLKAQLAGN